MGLSKLTLVQPEDFPSGVAVGRAVGAVDILDNARVVASLQEAVEDCGLIIGASARSRNIPWPMVTPEQCAHKTVTEAGVNKVALVFGREDSGLSNEELQLCHFHVQILANPDYSSLNLAMAVQVICYELRMALLNSYESGKQSISPVLSPSDQGWDEPLASVNDVEGFVEHLEKTLILTEFHDPKNPRQLMTRLRRLFQRAHLDKMEVNILRGILTSIQKIARK